MQLIIGSGKNRKVQLIPAVGFGQGPHGTQDRKIAREKIVEGVKALILRPATFRGFS